MHTPLSSPKERDTCRAIDIIKRVNVTPDQVVRLAVHRIIDPQIIGNILGQELNPADPNTWPQLKFIDRAARVFERRSVVSNHDTRYYGADGESMNVHEYVRAGHDDPKSVVKVPTEIIISPSVRRLALADASLSSLLHAHTDALSWHSEALKQITPEMMTNRRGVETFARCVVERIYHAAEIAHLSFDGKSLTGGLSEVESQTALQRIKDQIHVLVGDKVGLSLQLMFAVFVSVHGTLSSEDDPDLGHLLPSLLKDAYHQANVVPIPVRELTTERFNKISDAVVQDGWDVMLDEPDGLVVDRLPALDRYLGRYQGGVKFQKLVVLGEYPDGGIFMSNGMRILVERSGDKYSFKDTVMAVGQDTKGNIHIYDCHEDSNGRVCWKKVGTIETKPGENKGQTHVEYRPVSKSLSWKKNTLTTFAHELTGDGSREINDRDWNCRNAMVVISPRNESVKHDMVSVHLRYKTKGVDTSDKIVY